MIRKVIAAIHLHGAGLWLKGARFHRKPPAPVEQVTLGAPAAARPRGKADGLTG
jgi:DUF1365 family protein